MRIGCHVSISGGIHCAVDNASKIDGTAFQIFTRNRLPWIQMNDLINTAKNPHTWRQRLLEY